MSTNHSRMAKHENDGECGEVDDAALISQLC